MFDDIRYHITFCNDPGCVAANVVLLIGAFLLGIWMAYEIWRKPWKSYFGTTGANPYGMAFDDRVKSEESAAVAIPQSVPVFNAPIPAPVMREPIEPPHEGELVHDPELGPIYNRKPALQDDLKKIHEIGHVLESKLHYYGIYRYEQIANWTPGIAAEFAQRLTLTDQIERDGWIAQAKDLMEAEARRKAVETPKMGPDYEMLILSRFPGDDVKVDGDLGIVYATEPEVADDLQEVDGIGDDAELKLNEMGVFRLKQIASWWPENIAAVARKLGIPADKIQQENWVKQAEERYRHHYSGSPYWRGFPTPSIQDYQRKIQADYAGEPVKADAQFGIVYTRAPEVSDDLRKIRGMTDQVAVLLRGSGVFRFQQVADWSEANVDAFARVLNLHAERIYRDGWIHQAAELAAEARKKVPQLV